MSNKRFEVADHVSPDENVEEAARGPSSPDYIPYTSHATKDVLYYEHSTKVSELSAYSGEYTRVNDMRVCHTDAQIILLIAPASKRRQIKRHNSVHSCAALPSHHSRDQQFCLVMRDWDILKEMTAHCNCDAAAGFAAVNYSSPQTSFSGGCDANGPGDEPMATVVCLDSSATANCSNLL